MAWFGCFSIRMPRSRAIIVEATIKLAQWTRRGARIRACRVGNPADARSFYIFVSATVAPAVLPVRDQDICDKRYQDIRDIGWASRQLARWLR